jgi:hypothetical protein
MNEVDRPACERRRDRGRIGGLRGRFRRLVDDAGLAGIGTSVPATREPAWATTIERWPAATSAASRVASTCSAPPTASVETGARGKATLRIVRLMPA